MAGGGGGGNLWVVILVIGGILVAISHLVGHGGWFATACQAVGGIAVVFGSCEAMIKSVEGLGERLRLNQFVAGTLAGLASNLPEVVMLAFVIAKAPRVAFVVAALTLHVGALAFGVYSSLLPRDERGQARLPEPLVKLSTDLFACAGGIFLILGTMMVMLKAFDAGDYRGEGLGAADLFAIGGVLLFVEVVAVHRLIKQYSTTTDPEEGARPPLSAEPLPSVLAIVGFGVLGVVASVIGGHSVGEFADTLVSGLRARGYSEMVGAIILSVFAAAGAFLMIATAHFKGMYDLALANVSGQVSQVPFVVLPISLILMGVFAQTGVIPRLPHGGVLAIDLETTSVILFGFPIFLILWKSINDDGKVNTLETASMIGVFALIIFLLAVHG